MRPIVIIDCGSQYTHLIEQGIRRLGRCTEVVLPDTGAQDLRHAAGIIISGGPGSVYEQDSPQPDPALLKLGVPVLGICYGLQWICHVSGGRVAGSSQREYGGTRVHCVDSSSPLLSDCDVPFEAWMSHGDTVSQLPPGFRTVAISDDSLPAVVENGHIFGVQFHPEVTHTRCGQQILSNFALSCNASPWSMADYQTTITQAIREQVGQRTVFMFVSGGVDSTVAYTLLCRALDPAQVRCIFVDNGLMRHGEVAEVRAMFTSLGCHSLQVVDAADHFFAAVAGIIDPQAKRACIGHGFFDVLLQCVQGFGEGGWVLGQGTTYPDTIESGATTHARQIKLHHNLGEAIVKLGKEGRLIEPLRDLFKDQVRALGRQSGLSGAIVDRHPFPGPGLGIRCLCSDGQIPPRQVLDFPFHNFPGKVLPVCTVGVQGDRRTYHQPFAIFQESPEVVTEETRRAASNIPNRQEGISRVLQCLSHSSAPQFRLSAATITRPRIERLRRADAVAHEVLRKHNLVGEAWQFPVVSLPLGISPGGETIVLRPVGSVNGMTADAVILPARTLRTMTEQIMKIAGVDCVMLDLTSKPPATIEWE